MSLLFARDLAADIQAGRTTPRAVMEQVAAAIADREGEVHAFAALDLDAAFEATGLEGLAARPLAGLPVGIKDILDTRDLPTAYGSPIYAGHRPRTDAPAVGMVRRAGGIVAGKTVTTEFAFLQPSATRNPRRLTHTPGGSSAGSAAAVAAGMLPVALGTQTAGSVIRPAAFCGVTGYKPTFRLLPTLGMKTFSWHLDTVGLFAARVRDAAFAAAAISGRDLDIGATLAERPRLAIVRTARAGAASPEAHAALETAARAAEAMGARIFDLDLPEELEAADAAQPTIQDFEAALAFADELDFDRAHLSPLFAAHLDAARAIPPDTYDLARRTAKRARQKLGDLFGEVDALLTFSAPGPAPEGFATTGSAMFNRLWTLLGCPAINVAGLNAADGMPVGVQVVGRFGRDRQALAVGNLVETAISR
ncbi:amidase [Xanthobacter dioxanivorans]|uniref:Amidase n=1 Tax=Xanthobacter dioxanivorans TaxID=2528964 RepID=A0A974SIL4_9HYPH|nr:amidase [Xanthobacter dioxanivorans]QRG07511.1 amidase [Xanthobacter dioxanivorans]